MSPPPPNPRRLRVEWVGEWELALLVDVDEATVELLRLPAALVLHYLFDARGLPRPEAEA